MGRTAATGLRRRPNQTGGIWHIDKVVNGRTIHESCGTSDQDEAERYLARRLEEIRQASVYGVRPDRIFRVAATKYLSDNQHKASVVTDAYMLQSLDPFIGEMQLSKLHDGTLQAYITARRKAGIKSKSINNALSVVRRILSLSARKWRDEHGLTWLETPPLLSMLPTHDARKPYPISWEEQTVFMQELPDHLARMALFKVNTGTREQEVCHLRWDWEIDVPELGTSVFLIPEDFGGRTAYSGVKNGEDRLVVLNDVARSVVDSCRGIHPELVFTYEGNQTGRMNNSAWDKARLRTAMNMYMASGKTIPVDLLREGQRGILMTDELKKFLESAMPGLANVRVHDLKHTFGRRLRAAGVPLETRKVLLGHKNGDITSHYSAPEIEELLDGVNRVCRSKSGKSPAITLLKRKIA
ncbi:tyrosine-type recombinase/integrase [Gallionella capsiferriformans]|uniref:Integrase family protein n=1 Tax=Gallionella capsiferriformans (strain ES-2) TaxID=395494 RepID=D9SHG6_GALCS|nr:tyrosine-type recombinase/integrase [Gallionella capsiferriformans]ADL55963.1 integrase family protein [Gallionella capsiferriformans ES-2]